MLQRVNLLDKQMEEYIQKVLTILLLLWNWLVGTRLETPYPDLLVEIYDLPLTRIFLLGLVILSGVWCESVGLMLGFAFVCLGADVIFLTS
jgi:hypothetical protein